MKKMQACTECGVPGIGTIPQSFHFCNFYRSRRDLIDSVVPYFAAGLRNQERCIWMSADPLPADDAKEELARVVPGLEAIIKAGQIEIHDDYTWYTERDLKDAIKAWLDEEEKALAAGYQGLRIAGNTSFLTREMWSQFMAYEQAVDKAFQGRRITALCSYRLSQCNATDVFEAARNHRAALERTHGSWVLLPDR